jgi:hypothetical protein
MFASGMIHLFFLNKTMPSEPSIRIGPRGGSHVLTEDGNKIYIPSNLKSWKLEENGRWRIVLKDGTNMLLPKLAR